MPAKRRYEERRRRGVCVECGSSELPPDDGRVRCELCLILRREQSYRYRKRTQYDKGVRKRERNNKLRYRYRLNRRCVRCGVFLDEDCDSGRLTCVNCR